LVRRHGRAWNAGENHALKILIGRSVAELPRAQIHAGNQGAIGAMADTALFPVDTEASLPIGLAVLTGVILSGEQAGDAEGKRVQTPFPKAGNGVSTLVGSVHDEPILQEILS
jgi:hypothetical protein